MTEVDDSPAAFAAMLATGVAALVAAAVVGAFGHPLAALPVLAGVAAVRWGTAALQTEEGPEATARGSVGLVLGLVLLAVPVQLLRYGSPMASVAVVLATGGAAVVALDLVGGEEVEGVGAAGALVGSAVAVLVAVVLAAAVGSGAAVAFARGALASPSLFAGLSAPLAAFLLLVGLVVAGSLYRLATDAFRAWLPARRFKRHRPPDWLDDNVRGVTDLGPRFLAVLVAGFFVGTIPTLSRTVTGWLLAIPVVGRGLVALLRSGLLLLPVALAIVVLGAVALARVLQSVGMRALGDEPAVRLASPAGGIAVAVVGLLVVAVPPAGEAVAAAPRPGSVLGSVVAGSGAGAAVLLAALVGLVAALLGVLGLGAVPLDSPGLLLGCTALVVAGVATSPGGGSLVLTVATVAGALLVWDLGSYGITLGRQLGDADARAATATHATASLAVGVGTVVLVLATTLLVGPVDLPTGSRRASVSLVLLLVAVVSFAASVD